MEVRQDPICGAKQKGALIGENIYEYFHEKKSCPPPILRGITMKILYNIHENSSKRNATKVALTI